VRRAYEGLPLQSSVAPQFSIPLGCLSVERHTAQTPEDRPAVLRKDFRFGEREREYERLLGERRPGERERLLGERERERRFGVIERGPGTQDACTQVYRDLMMFVGLQNGRADKSLVDRYEQRCIRLLTLL
jgi:hypothetical protein